ncbi:glutamine amidotransferase-related protein, partial [Limosilactobacillus reuteri]
VTDALQHAGYLYDTKIKVNKVQAEDITEDNIAEFMKDSDGLIVPGGFGTRGLEGMITSIKYAREHDIPFLGICLGMQM